MSAKKYNQTTKGRKILNKTVEDEINYQIYRQKLCKSKIMPHLLYLALHIEQYLFHICYTLSNEELCMQKELEDVILVIVNKLHLQENISMLVFLKSD